MFPVFEVPTDAVLAVEQMGTKEKFWYNDSTLGRSLFKASRPGSGEDWSEKIAYELAALLGLPSAVQELAISAGVRGTVSPTFVQPIDTLVHGNELLIDVTAQYGHGVREKRYHTPEHTVDLITRALADAQVAVPYGWQAPSGIRSAVDVFAGYLMLDAWIGNTDRHHENWAVIVRRSSEGGAPLIRRYLAPTYDHASSMGRNESDENRLRRLETRDAGDTVEAYADRARSALYRTPRDTKPLTPLEAFREISSVNPEAALAWLTTLEAVPEQRVADLFELLPEGRISRPAIGFAKRVLTHGRARLLALRDQLV